MDESCKRTFELIELCKKGDNTGFEKLLALYSSRLYGYFYRLTGSRDRSDELLSCLFVRLVEKIGDCRTESFDGWLFRMAFNLFADDFRKRKKEEKMLAEVAEMRQKAALPEKKHLPPIDKLTENLQKLDTETAEMIICRYYSGMSFADLAKAKNMPLGSCLGKVHRGIKKLRLLMENEKKSKKF